MKAYMELKDILARTKHGTIICLLDLATDKIIAHFTVGKFDYNKRLPREVLDAEPFDFCVDDKCLTITICKDEDTE